MKPFHQSSYLSQVRRLRGLARSALHLYPLKVRRIDFIHHGENTTFKVLTQNNKKYLLRVHRNDYHTPAALLEEMKWLRRLPSSEGFAIPRPVLSKRGRLIETASGSGVPEPRNVSVFHWIEGTFFNARLKSETMFAIGQTLAQLQKGAPITKHRRYWTAEGLLGVQPKFGPVAKLVGASVRDQRTISAARKFYFRALKSYQSKFPRRLGLIHADAHFGNILKTPNGLGLIDFDDCGYGFHVYDLAVNLFSVEGVLGKKHAYRLPALTQALIEGYKTGAPWDKYDEALLPQLISARRILMLGWLNSRTDNPRLRKFLKKAVRKQATYFRKQGF